MMIVSQGLIIFVKIQWMRYVSLFLLGASAFFVSTVLAVESTPHRYNSRVIGGMDVFDGIKNAMVPTLYFWFISKNWIWLFMAHYFVILLPATFFMFFVQESPRWLYEKKRYVQLMKVINRIAKFNG